MKWFYDDLLIKGQKLNCKLKICRFGEQLTSTSNYRLSKHSILNIVTALSKHNRFFEFLSNKLALDWLVFTTDDYVESEFIVGIYDT